MLRDKTSTPGSKSGPPGDEHGMEKESLKPSFSIHTEIIQGKQKGGIFFPSIIKANTFHLLVSK